jgi:serine/threonine-protein kinase RsbW
VIRPQPPEDRGPGAPRDVEVRVPAVPEALVTVRTVAGDLALRAEFPLDAVDDLRLAVDEACTCLADLARPGTKLTGTFAVDEERISMTASVSTTGPTRLPTDTFAYRVLTVLADDVRVLAETPSSPGDAHRLALRLTMRRPDTSRPGDVAPREDRDARRDARDVPAVASMHDRPGTSGS